MPVQSFKFSNAVVDYHFAAGFSELKNLVDKANTVLLVDQMVLNIYPNKFKGWKTIAVKSGEQHKNSVSVDGIIYKLIELGANRSTTLVGVGGGVVTDITGYVASIYMRGVAFGFVPTTLLSLVDASIGGKNGIDVGKYKNMVGTIRQPRFILHDMLFLNSLPEQEWRDGFAEIIKHACIKDVKMFRELQTNSLSFYRRNKKQLCELVQRNALLKTKVVQKDEFEKGDRKLLNFGHTYGHAIETPYRLTHGQAVAVGMQFAAALSEKISGFAEKEALKILTEKYELPTKLKVNFQDALPLMRRDKKAEGDWVNFILLEKIGKAKIQKITFEQLEEALTPDPSPQSGEGSQ